jgi:hypothetical protein
MIGRFCWHARFKSDDSIFLSSRLNLFVINKICSLIIERQDYR